MTIELKTLFKKTSSGSVQRWDISVYESAEGEGVITTTFGQVDGKMQTTVDKVREGKNPGKKNATTPFEQALKEAEAKWTKAKKKGYVESLEAAQAGEVDQVIEGGIDPMLAHRYDKDGHKMVWPALASPKLDGLRLVAVIQDGRCTLWSRTRKPIKSLPHIIEALENTFPKVGAFVVDGEAYEHTYRSNFEKIVSLVRQDEPDEEHEIVQFHIFDFAHLEAPFRDRYEEMVNLLAGSSHPLVLVPHVWVNNEEEMMDAFRQHMSEGYEGLMLRNPTTPYEHRRSYGLLKVKLMEDKEFPIVGIEEGRGKLQGSVGAFVCELESGDTFKAKPTGELSKLKQYFDHPELWRGKLLTVQFQNLTSDGVPRFPVGLRIRDPQEI